MGRDSIVTGHKAHLIARLSQDCWEQVGSVDINEWWAGDCWRMRSIRQAYGAELFITFLVDLMWDRLHTGEEAPISAVAATNCVPESRRLDEPIAWLGISTRGFESKLAAFALAISVYRNTLPGKLLPPWVSVQGTALSKELRLELGSSHPLWGVSVRALAKREDNDDVLFSLEHGPAPLAVVHLTWTGRPETGGHHDQLGALALRCQRGNAAEL